MCAWSHGASLVERRVTLDALTSGTQLARDRRVRAHSRPPRRLGGVCRVRAKPSLSVAVLSRRVVSARDRALAHTKVMRMPWMITTMVVLAALVVVLCLVAVDVLSGFYAPVSSPD